MGSYNGSGTFNRSHDWTTDLAGAVPVTASRMDTEMDGFATGLSTCLLKDGQQTATARIPFAVGVSSLAGSITAVSYSIINDADTGLYSPGTDQWGLVAGGTATLTSTATLVTAPVAVSLSTTLAVTGAATLSSTLAVTGNVSVNTNKFNITAASGNTTVAGTLGVTGAATLSSTLDVTGNVAVNTNKFNITAASGNTTVAGTLGVTGAITGSSTIAGTSITASAALSGATVAGAMVATQAQMETGTATNLLVSPGRLQYHPGVPKAWARVDSAGTLQVGHNLTSAKDSTGTYTLTFTTAMSGTNYCVIGSIEGSSGVYTIQANTLLAASFDVVTINGVAQALEDRAFHVAVYGDQ